MVNNHIAKKKLSGKTILFVLDEFMIGGVVTYVSLISKKIIEMGGKVVILGFNFNLDSPQKIFPNCKLVIINQKPNYNLVGRAFDLIKYIKSLYKIFKNYKIDIIHFSTTWSSIYTLFFWKTWFVKRVATFHGSYYLESEYFDPYQRTLFSKFYRDKTHFLRKIIKNGLQVFTLMNSEKIHVLSNYSKMILVELIEKKLERKILVDSCVVDFFHEEEAQKNIAKWKINFSKNNKVFKILNFGRSEERKGIKVLLQACSILMQKYDDFNFLLTIATPATEEFLKVFQEYERLNLYKNVRFLHKIDSKKKEELISESDVFIMPSLDLETFGLTIVECLSYGLPVIGSSSSAIPEILNIVDKKLIYKSPNAEDLAKKIYWFSKQSFSEVLKIREKSASISLKLNIKNAEFINSIYS